MAKWLVVGIVAGLLVSCGGVPSKSVRTEEMVSSPGPGKTKASAGQVTFSGLTGRQLASIRVIPEEGRRLFQPENASYPQVDGFWWQGDSESWFKIPDFSEAWVGDRPSRFDGQAHRGELRIYFTRPAALGLMGRWSRRVLQPAWVPDGGATRSPVGRPKEF